MAIDHSGETTQAETLVEPPNNLARGTGEYLLPLPTVENEQERLDYQHVLLRLLLDGDLSKAPISSPAHVLDIGTGTGIWAAEFAKENPEAHVIGIDIAVTEPASLPSNCALVVADAEADSWPFSHKFDYIHLRMTISCFGNREKVLRNCFANLNPGGWIELQDMHLCAYSEDGSSEGSALETWSRDIVKGASVIGRNMHDTLNYTRMLAEEGFSEITETQYVLPWSGWSSDPKLKEVGRLQGINCRQGFRGASSKLLVAAGYAPGDIEELVRKAEAELDNLDVHAYYPFYVVYGQKPRD